MGNIATTLDEQIQLLKSRGMQLDYTEEKVKEILGDIGYYRLGFYWHPFQIDAQHNFKVGTKFSTIVSLYYLDSDLRNTLLRFINRIEIHFKNTNNTISIKLLQKFTNLVCGFKLYQS